MATVSRGTTEERFQFIARNRILGVTYLCDWLMVSPSGFYDWEKRDASKRSIRDQALIRKIVKIHKASRGTYGSPRVHRVLQSQGEVVGQNRVARLMRESDIKGRVTRVTRRQPGLKRFKAAGENLRLDGAEVTATDQVWVSDVTYLKLHGAWRYLAVVMDLYSRRVIGWSFSRTRTTDLTLAALHYAVKRRRPKPGLIFHTDRGIEFTAFRFRDELLYHGMRVSYNRPGCCTDNAHMESFFHSLKGELIRGRSFNSENDLRYALNDYINRFYNHRRLHSGIDYQPPALFEKMAA